jgi:hypothetical protein
MSWMEEPHTERFIAAHPAQIPADYTIWEEAPARNTEPITEADIWGEPPKGE